MYLSYMQKTYSIIKQLRILQNAYKSLRQTEKRKDYKQLINSFKRQIHNLQKCRWRYQIMELPINNYKSIETEMIYTTILKI